MRWRLSDDGELWVRTTPPDGGTGVLGLPGRDDAALAAGIVEHTVG